MYKTYLTKEGLVRVQQEFDQLVTSARAQQALNIKAAVDAGGYEDNLQYDLELEKQIQLERRITELEDILRNYELIDTEKSHSKIDFVTLGARVTVEADGERDSFTIVGSVEANPLKNLISNESPVGQALLGAKIGDVVEVRTPVVNLKYKILDIKYD